MSQFDFLGIAWPLVSRRHEDGIEYVVVQPPLQRILNFTGFTIDDVVTNPVARNAVYGYFRLAQNIERRCEIVELEKQWNG